MKAVFLLTFLAFFIHSFTFLDPDFGWHLRVGEIILSQGIPKTDPLSYTMPSYPFVDHEWLTNVILAKLYPLIGFFGLALVFSYIAVLALALATSSLRKFIGIPFLLSAVTILPFVGVRPQVITWFFFSLLLWVINKPERLNRWRFGLPILFLLWVNMHGGFALGIVVLFIVVGSLFINHLGWWPNGLLRGGKVNLRSMFGILLLCILATFINPYGWRIWREVWMQVSDTQLRWAIAEWLPAVFTINIAFLVLLPLSALLLWRYRKRFPLAERALFIGLLLAGLSSMRHVPLWVLVAMPLTTKAMAFLQQEAREVKGGDKRFVKAYRIFSVIVCLATVAQLLSVYQGSQSFREDVYYPKNAVSFLQSHTSRGEIFSVYEWGGYLDWKLPQKRVFIDGRMPSWRRSEEVLGESSNAFAQYTDVASDKISFAQISHKYDVDTVLLPVPKVEHKNVFATPFDSWIANRIRAFRAGKIENTIVSQIEKLDWREAYRDSVAVIYQKPKED